VAEPKPAPSAQLRVEAGFAAAVVLAIVSALTLWSTLSANFMVPMADETANAWAGKLAASGHVPYVDFFAFRPPVMVYGLAWFYELVGASLAAVRYLTVAWLVCATLLFYLLVRRRGVGAWPAAGTAVLIPALIVPVWPIPSHYWFAFGFVLAAAVLATNSQLPRISAFAAGIVAALAAGTLQHMGVFAIAIVIALLAARPRRAALLFAAFAGMLLPAIVFGMILYFEGALRAAWEHVVLWPFRNYRRPGGYNDVPWYGLLTSIASALYRVRVLDVLALTFLITIPGFAILHVLLSAPQLKDGAVRMRWLGDALVCALATALFLAARTDFIHVAIWTPAFLYVATRGLVAPTPASGRRVVRGWLLAGTALTVLRWVIFWVSTPPAIDGIARAEDRHRASVDSLLAAIPGAAERRQPVLWLSEHGSRLYFYHAPAPPPIDMVLPPSVNYNPPADYERLAAYARARRVPYILIPNDMLGRFLNDPSPVRDMLLTEYEEWLRFEHNTVYIRHDVKPAGG
jgi:hypothetical protein